MAYREFTDADGVRWEAWDVHPTHVERRLAEAAEGAPDRERRVADQGARMQVRPEFAHGWLAFQSRHERRRLAPAPVGWEELDDDALGRLCAQADRIGQPRRLVE